MEKTAGEQHQQAAGEQPVGETLFPWFIFFHATEEEKICKEDM